MIESARDRMESIGETGSEAGRERKKKPGDMCGKRGEEERDCMNERAGITKSHINSVPETRGTQRSAQCHSFLSASPALILVFAVQRCVQTCLPRCLASGIEYIKSDPSFLFCTFLLLKNKKQTCSREERASSIRYRSALESSADSGGRHLLE